MTDSGRALALRLADDSLAEVEAYFLDQRPDEIHRLSEVITARNCIERSQYLLAYNMLCNTATYFATPKNDTEARLALSVESARGTLSRIMEAAK